MSTGAIPSHLGPYFINPVFKFRVNAHGVVLVDFHLQPVLTKAAIHSMKCISCSPLCWNSVRNVNFVYIITISKQLFRTAPILSPTLIPQWRIQPYTVIDAHDLHWLRQWARNDNIHMYMILTQLTKCCASCGIDLETLNNDDFTNSFLQDSPMLINGIRGSELPPLSMPLLSSLCYMHKWFFLTSKISSNQIWVQSYFGQPLTYSHFIIFSFNFFCNFPKSQAIREANLYLTKSRQNADSGVSGWSQ
jgi:hypothetical protein